jgi:proteic killer suppression protein
MLFFLDSYKHIVYTPAMIRSFKCPETEKIFFRRFSLKLPHSIQERAFMKLVALDAALTPEDLRLPHSNHLETLRGVREGQLSIRINNQWRICFEWRNGGAEHVEIIDYH